MDGDPGLERFNALRADEARRALLACCAAARWAGAVADGRPYDGRAALRDAAATASTALTWDDIEDALAAHPRIGARTAGWSRMEQAGAAGADDDVRAGLIAGNRAYEERFGHVFLICATGLSGADMLGALRDRLGHDAADEREIVRTELGKIAALRLERLLDDGPEEG